MSKKSKANSELRVFWGRKIHAWQNSGLSIRQFCRKHTLSEPSFYHWRRTLGLHPAKRSESVSSHDSENSFIRISLPDGQSPSMELVLPAGPVLRIGSGVDPQSLRQVLSVLKQVGLC